MSQHLLHDSHGDEVSTHAEGLELEAMAQGRQDIDSFRKEGLLSFRERSHCADWYKGEFVSS